MCGGSDASRHVYKEWFMFNRFSFTSWIIAFATVTMLSTAASGIPCSTECKPITLRAWALGGLTCERYSPKMCFSNLLVDPRFLESGPCNPTQMPCIRYMRYMGGLFCAGAFISEGSTCPLDDEDPTPITLRAYPRRLFGLPCVFRASGHRLQ